MSRSVQFGTGKTAFLDDIEICGKTGTSQNRGKDHSVFFAFAPRENPTIAIAVYVENGGWGSDFGAPMASLMIEQYINGEIDENRLFLKDKLNKTNLLAKN